MAAGFYNQTEDQWGFAHVPTATPSDWWQLAHVPAPLPPNTDEWIAALTCDQNNPDNLYAVWVDDRYLRVSKDAGVSWIRSSQIPAPVNPDFNRPVVFSIQARDGQIFLFNQRSGDSVNRGIWRSLDDGITWTRLTTVAGLGYMSLASSKLWFAETATGGGCDLLRMNLDGSGREILGHSTATSGNFIVHALSDTLCLFTHTPLRHVYRVEPSGAVQICPSDLVPWDAIPLSPTVFVAAGPPTAGGNNVLVYRTTNAGTGWSLVKTITALEGFAQHGAYGSYYMIDAVAPARTDLVMTGHADQTVQQMFWVSSDAGLSWTKILNEADPFVDGFWTVYGPGGLIARPAIVPQVATPSRLATIVG